MELLLSLVLAILLLLHLGFLVLEMFLWTKPLGRSVFGLHPEWAEETKILAANLGLYNGFLAAGFGWALMSPRSEVALFFLSCTFLAGLFGAITVKPSIFLIQGLPALIGLILALWPVTAKEPVVSAIAPVSESQLQAVPIADGDFATCTKQDVVGLTLRIKSFECGADHQFKRLIANNEKNGFDLETKSAGMANSKPAIRVFVKQATAPIEAILPEVKKRSTGPFIAQCGFELTKERPLGIKQAYILSPQGAGEKAYEEALKENPDLAAPCGVLGVNSVDQRVFFVLTGREDLVVYADMGTERQVFDIRSLEPAHIPTNPVIPN
jgi:putative membrane protein